MSAGETINLALCVGVLGALIGSAIVTAYFAKRERGHDSRARRVDAYARWLAARTTAVRAAASFVDAFQSLSIYSPDGAVSRWRRDEAGRARAAWADAVRELDRAEAMLLAWSDSPTIQEELARFPHVHGETLRNAIDGGAGAAVRLVQDMQLANARATKLVRANTHRPTLPRSPAFDRAIEGTNSAIAFVRGIAHQWSRKR